MKKINDKEVIVGPVRFSYMHVFQPKSNDMKDGAFEYSVTLLFPKENNEFQPEAKEEIAELRKALNSAVYAKWGDKPPANLRSPLRDGDKEIDNQGEPKAPGYWFMNVSAKEQYKPLLIDGERNPVKEGWNSGDWGKVHISLFAYDQKGNKGVSAGLRAVQFLFKGESLGGGQASADAFDVVKTETVAGNGPAPDEYDPFADE